MTSEAKDTYKTILKPGKETLFKEKGSKFFGYALPVKTEDEIKECLETNLLVKRSGQMDFSIKSYE